MRIVKEEQKYWDYDAWNKTMAWYYLPLINNNIISNFNSKVETSDDEDCITVFVEYLDTRELCGDHDFGSAAWLESTQLPPHIKADYIITLTTPTINDALEIINNYQEYWPGVNLDNLSINQNKDDEAVTVLVFSNYEADIQIAEPEEGELKGYE